MAGDPTAWMSAMEAILCCIPTSLQTNYCSCQNHAIYIYIHIYICMIHDGRLTWASWMLMETGKLARRSWRKLWWSWRCLLVMGYWYPEVSSNMAELFTWGRTQIGNYRFCHPKPGLPVIFPFGGSSLVCQDFDGEPKTQARGQGLLLLIFFAFRFLNGKNAPLGPHTYKTEIDIFDGSEPFWRLNPDFSFLKSLFGGSKSTFWVDGPRPIRLHLERMNIQR